MRITEATVNRNIKVNIAKYESETASITLTAQLETGDNPEKVIDQLAEKVDEKLYQQEQKIRSQANKRKKEKEMKALKKEENRRKNRSREKKSSKKKAGKKGLEGSR